MGVRVRLTRNTSMWVPFWVAIPAWILGAAVMLVVHVCMALGWLVLQAWRGIDRLVSGTPRAVSHSSGEGEAPSWPNRPSLR